MISIRFCLALVILTAAVGGCENPTGTPQTAPLGANAGDDELLMPGDSITLTARATGGAPPYLFRWRLTDQPDGAGLTFDEGVTDPVLDVGQLDTEGRYVFRVRVTDSSGATDNDFVVVNVGTPVTITATADAALKVVGEPSQLSVAIADSNGLQDLSFTWEVVRGDATFSDAAARNPEVTLNSDETVQLRVSVVGDLDGAVATGNASVIIVGVSDRLPQVVITNSGAVSGEIVLELFTEDAPLTCANFLRYVDDEFYDGIVWHRVVSGFVIQAGAFERVDGELTQREGVRDPVMSEADNGFSNTRGFVAMALRGQDANSGTNQFFINLDDNSSLDTGPPPFTPFARVVSGLDVVDEIGSIDTGNDGQFMDVPVEDIIITSIRRQ